MTAPAFGALAGLRVIELAGQGPVPFAAALLADHGADVTRVSAPRRPSAPGLDGVAEPMTAGRTELVLDLKDDGDRAALLDRIADADAFIEGFRPGVTERLGIGPDDLLARNERLVYVRVSGWGQQGPLQQRAGHDINYLARRGALAAIGDPDHSIPPLNLVADYGAGAMLAALGLLAALRERDRSGRGQVVDAALADGVSYLLGPLYELWQGGAWSLERGFNVLDGGAPFYGVYTTADGGQVAVGALEGPFYTALCRVVGVDDHPAFAEQWDRDAWPAMRVALTERFLTRTRGQWAALAGDVDACLDPVLSLAEVVDDPSAELVAGPGGWSVPAPAPRFSLTPGQRVSAGSAGTPVAGGTRVGSPAVPTC